MLYIKTLSNIRAMAEGGRLLYEVLELLKSEIRPGIRTKDLNKSAECFIIKNGAVPGFKGYGGFPAGVCISVNEQVIHGFPSERVLKEGDIVSLDAGVYYKGFHTDAARTYAVGKVSPELQTLMEATEQSFYKGMLQARVGNRISDISHAVEEYIKPFGYGIVRDFTGHGVGFELHEDPAIPNYGKPGRGVRIQEGMTLAIEPMITLGSGDVEILSDGWTTVTRDGSYAAHYENTVAVVDGSPVILTAPDVSI
ncbi:MAG TPA: type I methionyl aminopeptidase [Firmicutes bacterium]|nr:type I methionyl aminopeptidase [Bacillota bacterium]